MTERGNHFSWLRGKDVMLSIRKHIVPMCIYIYIDTCIYACMHSYVYIYIDR